MKKISDKRRAKLLEEKWEKEKMFHFFMDIWDKTPKNERKCYETGKWLGNEPLSTFFHHILEKEKYPEYCLCEWNIVLLHPDVHNQVHSNIDKTPKVKALREEILKTKHYG
jgi:hypothetical protein